MRVSAFATVGRARSVLQGIVQDEGVAWLAREPRSKLAAFLGRGPAPAVPRSGPAERRLVVVSVRRDEASAANLLSSPALRDPSVQLVLIDDAFGLRHGSLSRGLTAGLGLLEASSEPAEAVLAFVDQRVWLPDGWPGAVDAALRQLESRDPDWGVAGVSGLTRSATRVGHLSDPWGFIDTFTGGDRSSEAAWLEDHVLLLPASRPLAPDADLPGFEGLGVSLSEAARAAGRRPYVIDAPAIVDRRDHDGRLVRRAIGSRFVRGQMYRQQRAQREVTMEYLAGEATASGFATIVAPFRWSAEPAAWRRRTAASPRATARIGAALDQPLILLAKGGGGSRLLSLLAADCGVCLGSTNVSGDSLEMVPAIYASVLRVHDCRAEWQRARAVAALREGAAALLRAHRAARRLWGFKVPESLLLVSQLHTAFPGARFLFLARHPVSTCLRRVHMTAQLENPIGRVSLAAAYRSAGLSPEAALADPIELRSARVTLHQVGLAVEHLRHHVPAARRMEIRFDDLVARPVETRAAVADWLGVGLVSRRLEGHVDAARAGRESAAPDETRARIERLLAPLSAALGFASWPDGSGRA
jgi:hypothetical protein